jgi:hypothetical protein
LNLLFRLPSLGIGFDEGALDFLTVLRMLERLPHYKLGFMAEFRLWEEQDAFVEKFRQHASSQVVGEQRFVMSAANSVGERVAYNIKFNWEPAVLASNILVIETYLSDTVRGYDINLFIETIDTVITWKRPQHLRCGPSMYFLNDHPLDKARSGLGWLGWLPFDISPSEVPEAAIVLPMHGGTFLASQRDWWIAAGPQRDEAAVQRAQVLELRLNALGLLPTNIELRNGTWGQGDARP